MAASDPNSSDDKQAGRKSGLIGTIAAVLIGTLLAAGAGFGIGNMLGDSALQAVADKKAVEAEAAKKAEAETPAADDGHGGGDGDKAAAGEDHGEEHKPDVLHLLEPVTVSLRDAEKRWLRVELALVTPAEVKLDDAAKMKIQEAILASLRENSLNDIVGPSGFLHMREDLTDTAVLSSDRQVRQVLVRSLIIE